MPNQPTAPPRPNHYAEMARNHMARYLPARFARIEDPEAHFAALGATVASAVEELTRTLAEDSSDPPSTTEGPGFVERMGRMNSARLRAEEAVLAELVYLTPEPGTDTATTDETGAYIGPDPGMTPTWEPLYPREEPED